MSGAQDAVTVTLPAGDLQLVLNICAQALAPYQRLAQVMQDLQRQAAEAKEPLRSRLNTVDQSTGAEIAAARAQARREVAP